MNGPSSVNDSKGWYYASWTAAISFDYEPFTLSFTYSNTSLTKENCFVFTGDPGAAPGGVIDPITNPLGLRSNWCGPAFVGTLSYEFSPGISGACWLS